jgi:single-stranded-DNA-specific exonuclease
MLVARGYTEPHSATAFLDSGLGSLGDPFTLDGMHDAVIRLRRAIAARERVAVYGDYDADGVTSTALLVRVFRALGADVKPFVPNRFDEGYGLSVDGMGRCIETIRPNLVLTADCGSCSTDAVEMAAGAGVDTVVTDHHEINSPLAGTIVVNPKRGKHASLVGLAGVGVAFKFAHALVKSLRADGNGAAMAADLRRYLDLVAVGTVADVAPLSGENRILVRAGLRTLNREPCVGIATLMERAGARKPVDARQISFVIGPRLNAAGRLSNVGPDEALALLMADSTAEAMPLADKLERANEERRKIESEVLDQALAQIGGDTGSAAVTVGREGWHVGTIGIVAARLCGRFNRPAAVIAMEPDGSGKGSCRSIEGVDVVRALAECDVHLDAYGGHAMAAGFRLKPGALRRFAEDFSTACRKQGDRKTGAGLRIDSWIGLGDATPELVSACGRCEPFGVGNPIPLWAAKGVSLCGEPRVLAGKHLAFRLTDGSAALPAIAFNKGDATMGTGAVDVAFRVASDPYRGPDAVQLQVVAWRDSGG